MWGSDGKQVDFNTYLKNVAELRRALQEKLWSDEVTAYAEPDNLTATMMEMNINRFSFIKNVAQMYELNQALNQSDSFSAFRSVAAGILEKFNNHWLRTEYDSAIAVAQNAAAWNRFKANKNQFPYLRYQTVGDQRVRASHAALDGKYFRIDDQSWWSLYPPNDWNCRCEMVQSSSAPAELLTDGPGAMGLLGANYRKMKEAGFAVNRGEVKEVFDLNKAYIRQLPTSRNIDKNKLTYIDAGLQPFKKIKRTGKPHDETASLEQIRKQFGDSAVKVYQDKSGRLLGLSKKAFEQHIKTEYTGPEEQRHTLFGSVNEVLNGYDEVWFNEDSPNRYSYRYIKFYDNSSVVVVAEVHKPAEGVVRSGNEETFQIKTWYETKENSSDMKTDDKRRGLLIEKGY